MRTRMDGVRHKQRNISSAYLCNILRRLDRLYMKTDARFILNRGFSPAIILMKQAKKNSFKMLPSIFSRASCAYVLYLE